MTTQGPDRTYQAAVGRRLRERREELGLSIRDAADQLPWSASMLGYWERGQRALRVEDLAVIAGVYEVATASLMPADAGGRWWAGLAGGAS